MSRFDITCKKIVEEAAGDFDKEFDAWMHRVQELVHDFNGPMEIKEFYNDMLLDIILERDKDPEHTKEADEIERLKRASRSFEKIQSVF